MLVTMKKKTEKKSERTLRNRLLQAGMVMAAAVILFASMGLPAQAGKKRRAQTVATPLTYGDAYIIKFDGNGATGGVMDDMVLPTGLAYPLETNRYTRTGYSFAGWSDASGNVYNNNQVVQNLKNGRIESRKLAVFSAGFPINQALKFRSTQGSVVFDRNGHRYLAFTASINDPSYYAGDLSHYETAVLLYDLTTGQLVADVHNLNFDHGNSMCYNPDNGHIYIAEGGSLPGYPSGIMELTWDLKAIDSHGFPDLGRAFSITYANGQYFVIGKGPRDGDATTLFRLNSDMQMEDHFNVSKWYPAGYSPQGIAADDHFVYCIAANFSHHQWKKSQKVVVFTRNGLYAGTWSLDITKEAEDMSILGNDVYITTNDKTATTLYQSVLPSVKLYAQWVPAR